MLVKNSSIISCCLLILVVMTCVSICIGRYPVSVADLFNYIFTSKPYNENLPVILFKIRLPRIIGAVAVGGALSVSGTSYQGVFRNPMVSPDILGVTSGAGFGAALAIILSMPVTGIQIFSFTGGMCAMLIATGISRALGKNHDIMLILVLSGIIISSLFGSMLSMMKYLADTDDKLPAITYWLMGSLASITMSDLLVVIPLLVAGIVPLIIISWKINVLSLGEDEALSTGVNTTALRAIIIICASLTTACTISVTGMIGWVGLVVPHLARLTVGPDHKILIPVSFLFGGIFLLLVDNFSRAVNSIEIPIGILTSIIGAPFFIYFLKKSIRRSW